MKYHKSYNPDTEMETVSTRTTFMDKPMNRRNNYTNCYLLGISYYRNRPINRKWYARYIWRTHFRKFWNEVSNR